MAKIISHNPFIISGKSGNLVYYSRNGKYFTRKLPVQTEKIIGRPISPQQEKFTRLVQLLKQLCPLFKYTFSRYTRRMSGFNKAISTNFQNGFIEKDPSLPPDFSKLVLGDGFTANAKFIHVLSKDPGTITFDWLGKKGRGATRSRDILYLAVYCNNLDSWHHEINTAERRDGICTIDIPQFKGNPVHVYMGFISKYLDDASASEYLGVVNV